MPVPNEIIKALAEAFIKLKRSTPANKTITLSKVITGLNIAEVNALVEKKEVPPDAYFDGRENGYDAWDEILLSWDSVVPTSDEDKLEYKRRRFTRLAFKSVSDYLMKNGYRRVGFNSGLLRDFDDTTVYDMYINKDIDRLVKYYSLSFKNK